MSSPFTSVYATLIESYPTWAALKEYLTSDACRLRVDDYDTLPGSPYALIRYVKGVSDLTNFVVRAFRSVVWDTLAHRPVSVTSWKSEDSEGAPAAPLYSTDRAKADFTVEAFLDGTLIGMFWDSYSNNWRIHTRSILDARCRFYSTTSFADMFWACAALPGVAVDLARLDKTRSYSWVLQHPANRIVCAVDRPSIHIVDVCFIKPNNCVEWESSEHYGLPKVNLAAVPSWDSLRHLLAELNSRFGHNFQGYVIKNDCGGRWKLRTPEYNRVRLLRGNSPRRDYLWLKQWQADTLRDYLRLYPEERFEAEGVINRWKTATTDVYRIYCDVFKARTMPRSDIPVKYRPLVYGLHTLYLETLKPAGKTVDWKACLEWMNRRDVAQMLFVINWELRQSSHAASAAAPAPFEPLCAVGTTVADAAEPTTAVAAAAPAEPAAAAAT